MKFFSEFHFLTIGFTCLSSLRLANGHAGGAPSTQCDTMVPKHGPSPQRTNSPYQVLLSRNSIDGGQRISVRLAAPKDPFKGFLAMGFKTGSRNGQSTGRIEMTEENQLMKYVECFGVINTAVTHTSNEPKKSIEFDWIAPNEDGTYVILVTFVKDHQTFWVKVTSPPILVKKDTNFFPQDEDDNGDKNPYNGQGNPDVYAPIMTELNEKYYKGCGKTKGCFGFPENCLKNQHCDMFTSWRYDAKTKDYKFQIAGRLPGWVTYEESVQIQQGHISSGLSFDNLMGQDSVIGCVFNNGAVKPKSYFNVPNQQQNSLSKDEYSGLVASQSNGKYLNGYLFCEFTRTTILTDTSKELGQNFDLEKDSYYVIMARAKSMDKNKQNGREKLGYHLDLEYDKCATPGPVNLKQGYKIESEGGNYGGPTKKPNSETNSPSNGESDNAKSSVTSVKIFSKYFIAFCIIQFHFI